MLPVVGGDLGLQKRDIQTVGGNFGARGPAALTAASTSLAGAVDLNRFAGLGANGRDRPSWLRAAPVSSSTICGPRAVRCRPQVGLCTAYARSSRCGASASCFTSFSEYRPTEP